MLFGKAVLFWGSNTKITNTIKQNNIKHAEITAWLDANPSKTLEDGDETWFADVTDNFTEFSNGSYVLLEPVTGPKDSLHTRQTGPYLIVESNYNNYTLVN